MEIILESKKLTVILDSNDGTVCSIKNKDKFLELIQEDVINKTQYPFSLLLINKNMKKEEITKFNDFRARKSIDHSGYVLQWNIKYKITVKVNLLIDKKDESILMYPEVLNTGDSCVISLTYPIFYPIANLNGDQTLSYLAHPVGGGMLFEDPYHLFIPQNDDKTGGIINCRYPDGDGAGMQFIQYYRKKTGGFYIACHDPFDTCKEIDFFRKNEDSGLTLSITHKSWDIHQGSGLKLDYPIVLKPLLEGDWREGAEKYREWATGTEPGSPTWCSHGRLEDRVHSGGAAKWLIEDVGLCVFGIPSSVNVTSWLEHFHKMIDRPVLFVFGNDWPSWCRSSIHRTKLVNDACHNLKLPSIQDLPYLKFWPYYWNNFLRPGIEDPVIKLANDLEIEKTSSNIENLQTLISELTDKSPWPSFQKKPLEWFPSRYARENLEIIRKNGDYYVPFFFDFFGVGDEVKFYGIVSDKNILMGDSEDIWLGALQYRWMDPSCEYWQSAHAERSSRIIAEDNADGVYYDISACCGIMWTDRSDHDHPIGYGRWLIESYRKLWSRSMKSMQSAGDGNYYPLGVEEAVENFLPNLDFSQWRAGGQVQGDIEIIKFIDWMKDYKARHISLFSYVYHEYGPVFLDGWAKLSHEFGDIFYFILAEVLVDGGIPELNYEYSPLEGIPESPDISYQFIYFDSIYIDNRPLRSDIQKELFLHTLASARTTYGKKYLCYGKAIKPATISTEIPFKDYTWSHYNSLVGRKEHGIFKAESIIHRGWAYKDISLGYIFINTGDVVLHDIGIVIEAPTKYVKNLSQGIFIVQNKLRKKVSRVPDKWPVSVNISLLPREIVLIEFL